MLNDKLTRAIAMEYVKMNEAENSHHSLSQEQLATLYSSAESIGEEEGEESIAETDDDPSYKGIEGWTDCVVKRDEGGFHPEPYDQHYSYLNWRGNFYWVDKDDSFSSLIHYIKGHTLTPDQAKQFFDYVEIKDWEE